MTIGTEGTIVLTIFVPSLVLLAFVVWLLLWLRNSRRKWFIFGASKFTIPDPPVGHTVSDVVAALYNYLELDPSKSSLTLTTSELVRLAGPDVWSDFKGGGEDCPVIIIQGQKAVVAPVPEGRVDVITLPRRTMPHVPYDALCEAPAVLPALRMLDAGRSMSIACPPGYSATYRILDQSGIGAYTTYESNNQHGVALPEGPVMVSARLADERGTRPEIRDRRVYFVGVKEEQEPAQDDNVE